MTQIRKASEANLDQAFQVALLKIATKAMMETLTTAQLRRLAAYIIDQPNAPRPIPNR